MFQVVSYFSFMMKSNVFERKNIAGICVALHNRLHISRVFFSWVLNVPYVVMCHDRFLFSHQCVLSMLPLLLLLFTSFLFVDIFLCQTNEYSLRLPHTHILSVSISILSQISEKRERKKSGKSKRNRKEWRERWNNKGKHSTGWQPVKRPFFSFAVFLVYIWDVKFIERIERAKIWSV